MKNLATLKKMNSAIFEARNAYRKAVAENLMETGELRVKGDDDNEECGYPAGKLLSVPDKHGYMVDCVYDAIKASEKGIEVHICYFDDGEEHGWQWADELSFDDLDCIIDGIQWPEKVKQGEAEPEDIWVLFDESLDDYQLAGRRIQVFKSEDDARKAFKETADKSRKTAKANGWVIGNDDADYFDAYPDGSWGTSHETVELHQCKMNEAVWCNGLS